MIKLSRFCKTFSEINLSDSKSDILELFLGTFMNLKRVDINYKIKTCSHSCYVNKNDIHKNYIKKNLSEI